MGLTGEILQALALTVQLALVTTLILLVLATPLAWWLARGKSRWREVVASVVTLPLVLPPTVIGFYLLIALGPYGPGGVLGGLWGMRTIAFSFTGLVIGSIIYSLPFMVQPLRTAFEAISKDTLEVAASLGARPLQTFVRVAAPVSLGGFISGTILTFAHTIGEFGVVLMIGGNIPGQTKVLSIAIYDFIERGEWGMAHIMAAAMVLFGFAVVTATSLVARRHQVVR